MLYFRLMSDKLRQVCHLLLSSRQGVMNRAFDVDWQSNGHRGWYKPTQRARHAL